MSSPVLAIRSCSSSASRTRITYRLRDFAGRLRLIGVLGHYSAASPPFAIEGESGFAKIAVIGIVHEQGPLNESTIPASSLLWMHARHQAPGAWPSR